MNRKAECARKTKETDILLSLDLDMLALLFAVLGAYFFLRDNNMLYGLAGIISVTLSLGLFQSYIEVTILLVCLALLRDLLEGGKNGRP